jgi:hypothetical protein
MAKQPDLFGKPAPIAKPAHQPVTLAEMIAVLAEMRAVAEMAKSAGDADLAIQSRAIMRALVNDIDEMIK